MYIWRAKTEPRTLAEQFASRRTFGHDRPTEKQVSFLRKLGYSSSVLYGLTRTDCSRAIEFEMRKFQARRLKRVPFTDW